MNLTEGLSSPQYHVAVLSKGGQRVDVSSRVLKLTHTDSARDTPKVEIEVDNSEDFCITHPDLMRKGAVLQVQYGYPSAMRPGLEFIIKHHKGNDAKITIEGIERKQSKLSRKTEARVWQNMTRSAVVLEVLQRSGIPSNQCIVDMTHEVLQSITQTDNDWVFLDKLALLEGFEFFPDVDGIHWHAPQRSKRATHLFRYAKNVYGIGVCSQYSIDSFAAGVPGRVKLKGRNPRTKKFFEVVASETHTEGLVLWSKSKDIKTPEEGDALDKGDDGFEIVRNCGAKTAEEAKRLADAMFKEYRYNALKVSVTVAGDPTLKKGNQVVLWGIGQAIDGTYYAREITHTLDSTYTCSIQCTRDGPNNPNNKALDQQAQEIIDSRFPGATLNWGDVRGKGFVVPIRGSKL